MPSAPPTDPDISGTVNGRRYDPQRLRELIGAVLSAAPGTRMTMARSLGAAERSAEYAEIQAAVAAQLAPALVGLSIVEAQARVDAEPGLSLRFAPITGPVSAEFEYGRITAWTRAGLVVESTAG